MLLPVVFHDYVDIVLVKSFGHFLASAHRQCFCNWPDGFDIVFADFSYQLVSQ